MVNFENPIKNWPEVQNEIVDLPRVAAGTKTPSGAVMLGQGQCSDVWGFDAAASEIGQPLAVKLYRRNDNMPVPMLMQNEIIAYEKLADAADTGLPQFFGHGAIESENKHGEAFGWLLLERLGGKTLGIDDLNMLHPPAGERWARDLISSALKLENTLAAVKNKGEAPEYWNKNYAEIRLGWMKDWRNTPGKLSDEHYELAQKLADIIGNSTAKAKTAPIYMHGDISTINTIVNLDGLNDSAPITKFVDPLFSLGNPAENMRQYTLDAPIAAWLADEYERQSGVAIDRDLMFAVGALTHLYIGLAVPASWPVRSEGLKQCLSRIGLDAV